jgi:hypothetical protein
MKVIILHGADGKQAAVKVQELLKKHKLDVQEVLLEGTFWGEEEHFDDTDRLALIFSPGLIDSPWVPFLLGFSLGRDIPILGYGAAAVPPAFADRILVLKEDAEFEDYLERESPAWVDEARKRKARRVLLDLGIPVTDKSYESCIKERNLQGVNLFLEAGFSPDAQDAQGVPAICLAVRSGDRGIVDTLLKAGANVNAVSLDRGGSALIDSSMGQFLDIGADLLAAGANVNVKSKDGQSALIFSVGLNDKDFTEMLLKAGANPDEPDALGVSARKYAVLFNKSQIKELFDKYADSISG